MAAWTQQTASELRKVRAEPGEYPEEVYERWRLGGLPIWAAIAAGMTPTPGSRKLIGRLQRANPFRPRPSAVPEARDGRPGAWEKLPAAQNQHETATTAESVCPFAGYKALWFLILTAGKYLNGQESALTNREFPIRKCGAVHAIIKADSQQVTESSVPVLQAATYPEVIAAAVIACTGPGKAHPGQSSLIRVSPGRCPETGKVNPGPPWIDNQDSSS